MTTALIYITDNIGEGANGVPGNGMSMGSNWIDDLDFLKSNGFAHEMGYCLGLLHTHYGTCDEGGVSGEMPCPEIVNQPTDPADPFFENCIECGDYVCDTHASSKLLNSVTMEGAECLSPLFEGCGGNVDILGAPFNPQHDNIMSYAHPDCMEVFTVEQGIRARCHILVEPILQAYNIGIINNVTLPIGTTVWDNSMLVSGEVVVPDGGVLEITDTDISFEGQTSGILIQPGGKLIVNNAILKGRECAPTNRRGIRVAGDNSQPHPDPTAFDPETDFSPHHGIAYLKNNSVVRDAKIGVSSGDGDDYIVWAPFGTPQPNFGGIIVAENTTFENAKPSQRVSWRFIKLLCRQRRYYVRVHFLPCVTPSEAEGRGDAEGRGVLVAQTDSSKINAKPSSNKANSKYEISAYQTP